MPRLQSTIDIMPNCRVFLEEPETVKALKKDAISAILRMKRTLKDKEPKLAGYVRHGMKSNMGAMTTSPAESQNAHIRAGPDAAGQKYQTHTSLRRILTRIQRNFRNRRAQAHAELARNTLFSSAWTRDYLIKKGQALLDSVASGVCCSGYCFGNKKWQTSVHCIQ